MSIAAKPNSALLIVGHGSTENPDSSTPYFEHADEIRSRGLFSEVHCCFWKEEPSMREAFYLIDSDEIYVVPDFISEGYFTQDVIPRELQLTGSTTVVRGKKYHYCLPVGVHRSMTDLILKRAKEVAPGVDPATTTLIITGHGTGLNQNSTKAIRDQVDLIAASDAGYAAVFDAASIHRAALEAALGHKLPLIATGHLTMKCQKHPTSSSFHFLSQMGCIPSKIFPCFSASRVRSERRQVSVKSSVRIHIRCAVKHFSIRLPSAPNVC